MKVYTVPMIKIEPICIEDEIGGTQYLDDILVFDEGENAIDEFVNTVSSNVTKYNSIILYRQDVRAFADKIGGKEAFRQIKAALRDRYTVLKLRYNPRTQEYCGVKTAFIIHKR